MLILSRKTGESIIIDGRILVKVVRIEGGMVKVGIEAPAEVPVHRQEVFDEIQRNNVEAVTRSRSSVPVPKFNPASPSKTPTGPESAPPRTRSAPESESDSRSKKAPAPEAGRSSKNRSTLYPRTPLPGQANPEQPDVKNRS